MLSGLYSERLNARGVNEPKRGGRERDCLEDHLGRSSARGPGGRGRKGGKELSANRIDGIQQLALCGVKWKLWVCSPRDGE